MKPKGPLALVLTYTGRCRGKLTASVVFAIGSVLGGLVPYWSVYQIIRLFLLGAPSAESIVRYATIAGVGYALKVFFYGISTTLSHRSAYTVLESIRLALATRLMKAPLGIVQAQTVGKLKNVMVDRVETIELPLAHLIPEGISNLLLVLGVGAYLVAIDWRMALAAMVCIPLGATVYAVMMRDYAPRYDQYMQASNRVNSVMVEYVEGVQVIKAFSQSSSAYRKYRDAVVHFRDYTLAWFQSTWKLMNLGNAILPSTLLGSLPIGLLLYLNGTLSAADLIMCLILPMGIIAPLTSFTVFVNDLKAIEYAMRDVGTCLALPKLSEPLAVQAALAPARHDVTLSHVSFAYENQEGHSALSDVSLSMPQGTFTAIVGPSGGGKSTLAKLIARFWDLAEGSIRIGGVDLRDVTLDTLSDLVSFVTQDNFLFDCSLMENIRLGNPAATDAQVLAAAKAACCDGFIQALPQGYQTHAGTAGNRLSGGEKQRIAIARSILKNAPIVILDEATAFADPENEDQIQRSIAALSKGKTLIVIAHRLSTIQGADQIAVLDHGRLIACAKHATLLETCDVYRELWQAHIGARQWVAKGGNRHA